MSTQGVFLSLDTLNLSPKSSGRSPFLWAVFFKIDQDSLPGAICSFSTGNHRNLGISDMSAGATIAVPDALNSYSTSVTTIEIGSTVLPATFGVAAVLMNDGGHMTAHGVAAGHAALNAGVQTILDELVAEAIETQQPPTQSVIENAINGYDLKGKVAAAVKDAQSFWENLWAWTGKDSEIGMAFQTWTQDDFNGSAETKPFTLPIADVWTLDGNVTLADECPASTSAALLDPFFNFTPAREKKSRPIVPSLSFLLDLMRDFRDKRRMLKETYLDDWWALVKQHTPEFAYRLTARNEVRDGLLVLTQHLVRHLQNDELIISRETIGFIDYFLGMLSMHASAQLKKDIEDTLSLVPLLHNKTLSEALRVICPIFKNATEPGGPFWSTYPHARSRRLDGQSRVVA